MKNAVVYSLALMIVVTPFLIIPGCTKSTDSDDDLIGNWLYSMDARGAARSEAVSFTIGDYVYVGTGTSENNKWYSNFYKYSFQDNSWTDVAALPGVARSSAVAFAVNNMGYVGTGYDGRKYLKDMWRYNPATNSWDSMAPFPGQERSEAVAFVVNGKGYIATGYNEDETYLGDLWEFTPTNDLMDVNAWKEKASLAGRRRRSAVAWVTDNKAYLCSGYSGSALSDLLVYDPATNQWTTKRKLVNDSDESYDDDYTNIMRYNAVAFTINNKAYLTTGENGSLLSTTWEYDYTNDQWTEKTSFSGSGRTGAVAFTLNNRGFVMLGRSGSQSYLEMYEFQPNAEDDDDDNGY